MRVLGLNAFHADASAVAVDAAGLVAAIEEERFTRVKHQAGFPTRAIAWCAGKDRGGRLADFDAIAIPRKPRAYLTAKAMLAVSHPRSLTRALARVRNLGAIANIESRLRQEFGEKHLPQIHSVEHHLAHIASAFLCSPFDEALCISVDGFGDFVSTMIAVGRGSKVEVIDRTLFPHSLGLLYTAVTQFLGFPAYGDEYKVMGLAAYGETSFVEQIERLVPQQADGGFVLDLDYFRHLREGVAMTWEDGAPALGDTFSPRMEELLGPRRHPEEPIEDRHRDMAASLQAVYERRFIELVRAAMRRTGLRRVCLAGGCAMNSVANGKLLASLDVDRLYIQAAAGDAGTALGAALWVEHCVLEQPRDFVMQHAYWGPEFDAASVRRALAQGIPESRGEDGVYGALRIRRISGAELAPDTAKAIADGQVVGWFQGRSEWGPRALGNRSILADPRRQDMRDLLNRKIKRRESFRPFAPSVLAEHLSEWFLVDHPDPFMQIVSPLRPERRPLVPAVTHVDGSGRPQTVARQLSPRYWDVIEAFHRATGIPMLLNTSFNEQEPIVNTPAEALACFLRTRMDRLVLGDIVVNREDAAIP